MLHLHRMVYPNEALECKASGKILMPGDFYYQDDETGEIIDAQFLYQKKMERRRENWPYTQDYENAQSQRQYEQELKQAEMEALAESVLDRPIWGRESENRDKEAGTYLGL